MNNTILILLIAALAIYVVVRQFTEQVVTPRSLLLLPALSAYASYMDLQGAFAHFSSAVLIIGLVLGGVFGIAAGTFRGKHTLVRLESNSGRVLARPDRICSITWLVLLVARITVIVVSYSPLGHNITAAFILAFIGGLFLISASIQKYMVYLQYKNFAMARPQQPQASNQRNK